MKILQLDPKPRETGTGGIIVEQYLYKAIKSVFNTNIEILSDARLNVEGNQIKKLFSYWKSRKEILTADFLLIGTSNRRLCFFLNYIKRKKKDIFILSTHHHFAFMGHKEGTFKRWFTRFYELNILNASDCIITFGDYTKDMLEKYVPSKSVICLGVPIERVNYPISNRKNGEMIYIGTIEERKGITYLIEALSKVPEDFHITLVGDYSRHQEYYSHIQRMIDDYHLNEKVTFTGRVSDEEKERILSDASLMVFPTTNEGYGMVIVEAMGHGIPVIAFNNSAIPYLIVDGVNGRLVKNLDSKDLAFKISEALSNPFSIAEMGNRAINTYLETVDVDEFMKRATAALNSIKKQIIT